MKGTYQQPIYRTWILVMFTLYSVEVANVNGFHFSHSIESTLQNPAKVLTQLGAKQLNPTGTEFEIEKGVILSLTYSRSSLAVAQITLTSAYKDPQIGEVSEQQGDEDQRHCCMSRIAYDRILRNVGHLRPIGVFVCRDPTGAIPTSGWVRWTEEYSMARVVRLEKNCPSPDSPIGCGIAKFTIFYWLPLEGRIQRKRLEKIDLMGSELIQYFVNIAGARVEVSESDYKRLHKGQVVKLARTLDSSPARIISIRHSRKSRR